MIKERVCTYVYVYEREREREKERERLKLSDDGIRLQTAISSDFENS